jgi:hypothetical protein
MDYLIWPCDLKTFTSMTLRFVLILQKQQYRMLYTTFILIFKKQQIRMLYMTFVFVLQKQPIRSFWIASMKFEIFMTVRQADKFVHVLLSMLSNVSSAKSYHSYGKCIMLLWMTQTCQSFNITSYLAKRYCAK